MTTDQRTDGRGGFRLPWANRATAPAAESEVDDALARIDPEAWTAEEPGAPTEAGATSIPANTDADEDAWSVAGWPGRKSAFDGEQGAPTADSAIFPGMGAGGTMPNPAPGAGLDEWPAVDVGRLRAIAAAAESSAAAAPAPAWPSSDPPSGARDTHPPAQADGEEPPVDLARLFGGRAPAAAAADDAGTPGRADSDADAAKPVAAPALATSTTPEPAATEPVIATAAQIVSVAPTTAPERRPARETRVKSTIAAPPPPLAVPGNPAAPVATSALRPNKFLADLTRAMQAAAQSARDESLARLAGEARQRVEEIEQLATSGGVELRRQADEDLAETREWSKAEIARIKDEAEHRIADRKTLLDDELGRHAEAVRRRADLVRETVSSYESRLAAFIEQLLAEEDPTRIATLAQNLPEPPILAEADLSIEPDTDTIDGVAEAQAAVETEAIAQVEAEARARSRMSAEAASAAEAAAMDGLHGGTGADAWFAAERGSGNEQGTAAERGRDIRTELVVTGLSSVAGIAGFKRELSGIKGVRSVGVSAGQSGEFVFALSHQASLDVAAALPTLTAFATQISGRRDGGLLVAATEPATDD